jgi:hypothetical protein
MAEDQHLYDPLGCWTWCASVTMTVIRTRIAMLAV